MPCPTTAGTACAVLPLGDSITEGYVPSGANGGYRVELFRQAVMAGKNITFVGTQMNGPTTVDEPDVPAAPRGARRLHHRGRRPGRPRRHRHRHRDLHVPPEHRAADDRDQRHQRQHQRRRPRPRGSASSSTRSSTRRPTALVVVASIIPIADDGTNQRIPNYNAAIPGLVNTRAAAGKHVVFVDNYAAFIKDTNYADVADGRQPAPERRGLRRPGPRVLRRDQRACCRPGPDRHDPNVRGSVSISQRWVAASGASIFVTTHALPASSGRSGGPCMLSNTTDVSGDEALDRDHELPQRHRQHRDLIGRLRDRVILGCLSRSSRRARSAAAG